MTTVIEISGENAFKSQEEILEFNKKHHPRIEEPLSSQQPEENSAMANLRAEMKKRIYAFSRAEKESSASKVAEFREKFASLKSKIQESKSGRQLQSQSTDFVSLMKQLQNHADLITNIEGSL